jgi:hypothetical protein
MNVPRFALAAEVGSGRSRRGIRPRLTFSATTSLSDASNLFMTGLDRDEYTVGDESPAMERRSGSATTYGFTVLDGDARCIGAVSTRQAGSGLSCNAAVSGYFNQLTFTASSGINGSLGLFSNSTGGYALAIIFPPIHAC